MKRAVMACMAWMLLLLLVSSPAKAATQESVQFLTQEQRQWLEAHPRIVVGMTPLQTPPFSFVQDGVPSGLAYDMLRAVSSRIGVELEFKPLHDSHRTLSELCNGTIDLVVQVVINENVETCLEFSDPYVMVGTSLFAREGDMRFMGGDYSGMKVLGYRSELESHGVRKELNGVSLRANDDDIFAEVADGLADGLLTDQYYAMQVIQERRLNLRLVRHTDLPPTMYRFGASKGRVELTGALNAALASLTSDERDAIVHKWVSSESRSLPYGISLTPKERGVRNQPLRLGVPDDVAPLSFLGDDGKESGVVGAYVTLLRDLGMQLERVDTGHTGSLADLVERGGVDVVIGLAREETREERGWVHSRAFLTMPHVIITPAGASRRVLDVGDLQGMRVAASDGERVMAAIRARAADVQFVLVDTARDGLRAVIAGRADAYVGNLVIADHLMRTEYPGKLQISAPASIEDELVLFVREQYAPLVTTFNRLLDTLGTAGQERINNRWLAVQYSPGMQWADIARWALPTATGVLLAFSVLTFGYLRIRREIRRRQRAEARLLEVNRHLPAVVYQLRREPCGRLSFTFVLGEIQAQYGVTADEALLDARCLFHRIHPDERAHVRQMVDAAAADVLPLDLRFQVGEGETWRWVHTRATAIRDADGSVLWSGYWVDVTRARMQAQALESALAARSDFLATMSHEIRTPMAGILGLLDMLGHEIVDADQLRILRIIDGSAQMLQQLLGDILDLSRLEAGGMHLDPCPTDLREVAGNVVDLLRISADEKHLPLHLHLSSELADAYMVDGKRLQQVLFNLLSNAIKFTAVGEIGMTLELLSTPGSKEGHRLRISVRDTGIGIPEQTQAMLFQPFVQGDHSVNRRFGGTGLGLSICRRLIEQMGGTITLTSVVDVGTRIDVELCLPIIAGGVLRSASDASTPALAPLAGHCILVAEDQDVNRILMAWRMQKLGIRCVMVGDGQEALAALRTGQFDLLITDCRMPLLDGFELVRRVRAHERATGAPALPVIAMTASGMPEQVARCMDAGMNEVLVKPATLEQLEAALRRWLRPRVPVGAQADRID